MSKNVLLRDVPDDIVRAIDKYAKENTGPGGRPSRDAAIQSLIRRGLQSGLVRGDINGSVPTTKREA